MDSPPSEGKEGVDPHQELVDLRGIARMQFPESYDFDPCILYHYGGCRVLHIRRILLFAFFIRQWVVAYVSRDETT